MNKDVSRWSLYISLAFHAALLFLILIVPPTSSVSDADYKQWVGRLAKPRLATLEPMQPLTIEDKIKEVVPRPKKVEKKPLSKFQPKKIKPAPPQKVAVQHSGLLALIGSPESGGELADVFGSTAAVNANIEDALKKSARVKLADARATFETKKNRTQDVKTIGKIRIASEETVAIENDQEQTTLLGEVALSGLETNSAHIDEAGVRGVLRRRSQSFQQCYESALKGRAIEGKITLVWTINAQGKVVDMRVADDRLKSPAVLDCVKAILTRTRFPKPKNGHLAKLKNTFVFQTAG